MADAKRDLWGDLEPGSEEGGDGPVQEIMEEQADLLAEKTHGRLVGKVEIGSGPGRAIGFRFMILVPALSNYRHELFYVLQAQLGTFPVQLRQGEHCIECNDQPAFEAAMGMALRSEATQKALGQLRRLAMEAAKAP